MCVCLCVRACVRVFVRACVRVCMCAHMRACYAVVRPYMRVTHADVTLIYLSHNIIYETMKSYLFWSEKCEIAVCFTFRRLSYLI